MRNFLIYRGVLLLLLIVLFLNLPLPGFRLVKTKVEKSNFDGFSLEPILCDRFVNIKCALWDSLIIVKPEIGTVTHNDSVLVPLEYGLNQIRLTTFSGDEEYTHHTEVYRAKDFGQVLVIMDRITPLPKILKFYAKKHPETVFSVFVKSPGGEWYEIKEKGIYKTNAPHFNLFNAVIIQGAKLTEDLRNFLGPVLLWPVDSYDEIKIKNTYIRGTGLTSRLEAIKLISSVFAINDTFLWTEPQKHPILGRSIKSEFYLLLSEPHTFYFKYPELMDSIIGIALNYITVPRLGVINVNGANFIFTEPRVFPKDFSWKIFVNGTELPAASLLAKGFFKLEPIDSVNNVKIHTFFNGKQVQEIEFVFQREQPSENTKGSTQTRKLVFSMIPAQGNYLYLISLFITAALIFTFGINRRVKK